MRDRERSMSLRKRGFELSDAVSRSVFSQRKHLHRTISSPAMRTTLRFPAAASMSGNLPLLCRAPRDSGDNVYCRRGCPLMNEYIGIAISFILAAGIAAAMVAL